MKKFGTSSVVVAAFVGPGTVLTCASAGVTFSYSLIWVMVFATAAVYVLQTFTAGSGILAGKGLGEVIRDVSDKKWFKVPLMILVIVGLWIGSTAFETGNLLGAQVGINILTGSASGSGWWMLPLVGVVGLILILEFTVLKNLLAGLVAFMSISFVGAVALAPVDWSSAITGLLIPSFPEQSTLTILALVGTTVVTYNLFLHAGVAKRYWEGQIRDQSWNRERKGMLLFLPLGGLISIAIIVAGAATNSTETTVTNASEFAELLVPVAGDNARYLFGLGLLAAGITSAITAPLAVAAGITELFDWQGAHDSIRYRALWLSVLLGGTLFTATGYAPLDIIIVAQAANGFLLPIMSGILVYVTLKQTAFELPKRFAVAGVLIVVFCTFLGLKTLAWVWGQVLA